MSQWISENFEHVLAGILLLARIGDVGTTWLLTPRLRLEGNPLVRILRWPFALATLLVCLVAYWSTAIAWAFIVASFLVSARNAGGIWMVRAFGEEDYYRNVVLEAARKGSFAWAVTSIGLSATFVFLAGAMVYWGSAGWEGRGAWSGVGIMAYAVAVGIHGAIYMRRIFRQARLRT